jgi:hypothetical protein
MECTGLLRGGLSLCRARRSRGIACHYICVSRCLAGRCKHLRESTTGSGMSQEDPESAWKAHAERRESGCVARVQGFVPKMVTLRNSLYGQLTKTSSSLRISLLWLCKRRHEPAPSLCAFLAGSDPASDAPHRFAAQPAPTLRPPRTHARLVWPSSASPAFGPSSFRKCSTRLRIDPECLSVGSLGSEAVTTSSQLRGGSRRRPRGRHGRLRCDGLSCELVQPGTLLSLRR